MGIYAAYYTRGPSTDALWDDANGCVVCLTPYDPLEVESHRQMVAHTIPGRENLHHPLCLSILKRLGAFLNGQYSCPLCKHVITIPPDELALIELIAEVETPRSAVFTLEPSIHLRHAEERQAGHMSVFQAILRSGVSTRPHMQERDLSALTTIIAHNSALTSARNIILYSFLRRREEGSTSRVLRES